MIAIFAFTKQARDLGLKIKEEYQDSDLFVSKRNVIENTKPIDYDFSKFLKDRWKEYDSFIMIMSTGIVVRTIACLLENKKKDPGVVVIDQKGKFVIPFLSSHLGGANELAKNISFLLNANLVLTTASDVEEIPAFDDIARKNNCEIENLKDLKYIASNLLEGENINIFTTIDLNITFPSNANIINKIDKLTPTVFLTEQIIDISRLNNMKYIIIRPKNLVVGIGCKKGKTKEEIRTALYYLLKKLNLSSKSIKTFSSIDIKKQEKGLLELSEDLDVPIEFYSCEEIKKEINNFKQSKFVEKTIGVGAVCEPCAYLSSKECKFLSYKETFNGITLAIVKDLKEEIRS